MVKCAVPNDNEVKMHMLSREQVVNLKCVSNTANAMAAQMGMEGSTYTGHAYGTFEAYLDAEHPDTKEPVVVRGIVEGTKWVEPYIAGVVTSTSRNAGNCLHSFVESIKEEPAETRNHQASPQRSFRWSIRRRSWLRS